MKPTSAAGMAPTPNAASPHSPVSKAEAGHIPSDCRAVSQVLSRVGDKWSILIVMTLSQGAKRFSELRKTVGGISQKMLTTTLRGLERDGLVKRTVTPSIPPRVDYELTELGQALTVPVNALGAWALANQCRVEEARIAFDARHGEAAS